MRIEVWAIGPAFGEDDKNDGVLVIAFVWGIGHGPLILGANAPDEQAALAGLFAAVKGLAKATAGSRN